MTVAALGPPGGAAGAVYRYSAGPVCRDTYTALLGTCLLIFIGPSLLAGALSVAALTLARGPGERTTARLGGISLAVAAIMLIVTVTLAGAAFIFFISFADSFSC